MNNTGCILTEFVGLLCTPEQALQMLLASELGKNALSQLLRWGGMEQGA